MERIHFVDAGHKYYRESDGMALMSVSHFHRLFTLPFDKNNAKRRAAQRILGDLYKDIKASWEAEGGSAKDADFIARMEAAIPHWETYQALIDKYTQDWQAKGARTADAGTEQHTASRELDISRGFGINTCTGEQVSPVYCCVDEQGNNTSVDLGGLPSGTHLELLLYHLFPYPIFSQSMEMEICGVAGQSDKVFVDGRDAFIADLKTNASLSDFPFRFKNADPEYHLYPFEKYCKTRLSPYKLQLPIYGWMLAQFGYTIHDLRILHRDGEIPLPYTPDLVSEAFSMAFTLSL